MACASKYPSGASNFRGNAMPFGESLAPTPKVCAAGPLILVPVMGSFEYAPCAEEEQINPTSSIAPRGSADQAIAFARLRLDTGLICSIGIGETGALARQMFTIHYVDLEYATRASSRAATVALGPKGGRVLTTSGGPEVPALSRLHVASHALVTEPGVFTDNADMLSEWRQRDYIDRTGKGGELTDRTRAPSECRWDLTGQWK